MGFLLKDKWKLPIDDNEDQGIVEERQKQCCRYFGSWCCIQDGGFVQVV